MIERKSLTPGMWRTIEVQRRETMWMNTSGNIEERALGEPPFTGTASESPHPQESNPVFRQTAPCSCRGEESERKVCASSGTFGRGIAKHARHDIRYFVSGMCGRASETQRLLVFRASRTAYEYSDELKANAISDTVSVRSSMIEQARRLLEYISTVVKLAYCSVSKLRRCSSSCI